MVYVSTTNKVIVVRPANTNPCAQPPIQMTISSLATKPKITHNIIAIVKQHDATGARPNRCIASPTDKMAKIHGIKPPKFDFHTDDVNIL